MLAVSDLKIHYRTLAGSVKALDGVSFSVADGEIIGVWTHSLAVGRHVDDPVPELLVPGAATNAEVAAALDRYRRFITG